MYLINFHVLVTADTTPPVLDFGDFDPATVLLVNSLTLDFSVRCSEFNCNVAYRLDTYAARYLPCI